MWKEEVVASFKELIRNLPGRKPRNFSVRIVSALAEIQTGNLPNILS
jgi:hypothetical protein